MSFQLQPQQSANLTYKDLVTGANPGGKKYVVTPTQQLQGFPVEILDSAFPTGISNTGATPMYFDIDGFSYTPPPWNPHGWFKMIHKFFKQVSNDTYEYSWGPTNDPAKVLWVLTVRLQ